MIWRLICRFFGHAEPDSRVAVLHNSSSGYSVSQCPRCGAGLRWRTTKADLEA